MINSHLAVNSTETCRKVCFAAAVTGYQLKTNKYLEKPRKVKKNFVFIFRNFKFVNFLQISFELPKFPPNFLQIRISLYFPPTS